MNIVRLTYASRLSKDCGPDAPGKIMTVSRRNNKKLGVTGALVIRNRYSSGTGTRPSGPV